MTRDEIVSLPYTNLSPLIRLVFVEDVTPEQVPPQLVPGRRRS